jgi:hypothetical protein
MLTITASVLAVCATACKYDLGISDVKIVINKSLAGLVGITKSDQTVVLVRNVFANEEQLARTLYDERFHVDQIRSGMGTRLPVPRLYRGRKQATRLRKSGGTGSAPQSLDRVAGEHS